MLSRIQTEQRLNALRRVLLNLHKTLLDAERVRYERVHGRITSGRLLQLALGDPQFAWLRPLSELVVRIDELVDAEQDPTDDDVKSLIGESRRLLLPGDSVTQFSTKYLESLQQDPAIVLAHREAALHLQKEA
jgi:hypothetical protein